MSGEQIEQREILLKLIAKIGWDGLLGTLTGMAHEIAHYSPYGYLPNMARLASHLSVGAEIFETDAQ
jgi:hypothetical protein